MSLMLSRQISIAIYWQTYGGSHLLTSLFCIHNLAIQAEPFGLDQLVTGNYGIFSSTQNAQCMHDNMEGVADFNRAATGCDAVLSSSYVDELLISRDTEQLVTYMARQLTGSFQQDISDYESGSPMSF